MEHKEHLLCRKPKFDIKDPREVEKKLLQLGYFGGQKHVTCEHVMIMLTVSCIQMDTVLDRELGV